MDRQALDTGIIKELPQEIQTKWFDAPNNGLFGRMGVNGDGSCFFHSVLTILNPHDFINLSEKEQIEIANNFRCKFSKQFSLNDFHILTQRTEEKGEPIKLRGKGSVEELEKQRLKKLEKEYKKAQKAFCEPKVWADETNIRIVSKLLNLNLVFVDFSKKSHVYCTMHGDEALKNMEECDPLHDLQKTGIIAWIDRSHFEPIVRIDSTRTGEITTLFNPSIEKDASFLLHFMTTYKKECNL
jgi:hypothetical protein